MTSVRVTPRYEDHLTYPMVIGHRIREVEGRIINNWHNSAPANITVGEFNQLLDRIEELERLVKQNGRTNSA